ncbi:hypothetical protein Bsel_2038 [[Bacillus] selenitireducens MLS10]|uniref:Uncharacterized protein n=2 Tax=Salisediminibacterium selenitireducens TaxID=85683 RepID=D6XUQ6_BACIE|nr:hypothetical protein Bsel_2038 [[Bacillus] selenitireducens MLS10]
MMKFPVLGVLLVLSVLLHAAFLFQNNQSSDPADAIPHLEQMLAVSAQLIMYDFNEELMIRLDQSLHLITISADELKDHNSEAETVWRQTLALRNILYDEADSEVLVERVRGEIRQEISLIIQEAVEEGHIDEIETKIRDLLEQETSFVD